MFSYLRAFLTVALLAGIGAGVVYWAVQMFGTTPLILEAEVYENAGASAEPAAAAEATAHTHEAGTAEHEHDAEAWAPADGWERYLSTLGADIVTGVGYAFLLTAAIVFFGKGADWRRGLMWGLAGFATFSLAPAFGLPPELPGTKPRHCSTGSCGGSAPRSQRVPACSPPRGCATSMATRSPWC